MTEDAVQGALAPPLVSFTPTPDAAPDVICFSHLRWDFVFQRPQHLMTRHARAGRVFYFEEPVFEAIDAAYLRVSRREEGLRVVTPVLPHAAAPLQTPTLQRLLDQMLATYGIRKFTAWYYTPLALAFSGHLSPRRVVYDCMDELSNFKDAPPELAQAEQQLLDRAHVVFTGGHSLFEAKRGRHADVHAFPSSIDRAHFAAARQSLAEPVDQRDIARPRLGFFGVLDERFDIDLVHAVALQRPDWQIVLVGPVVKIDPATLPQLPNIHCLGMKTYAELPAYLSGWDVAIMPFARNDATRYISPTKTPEYLAGGVPVVSTSIRDVVHDYGRSGLVKIADTPDDFVLACDALLGARSPQWLAAVDTHLAGQSWEQTFNAMSALIERAGNKVVLPNTTAPLHVAASIAH